MSISTGKEQPPNRFYIQNSVSAHNRYKNSHYIFKIRAITTTPVKAASRKDDNWPFAMNKTRGNRQRPMHYMRNVHGNWQRPLHYMKQHDLS